MQGNQMLCHVINLMLADRLVECWLDRLVVLAAADALDKVGNKAARQQITAAKVYVPNVVLRILDAAMQVSRGCTWQSLSLKQHLNMGRLQHDAALKPRGFGPSDTFAISAYAASPPSVPTVS